MTIGSRAEYANPRNEQRMKRNIKASDNYPEDRPTSTAWLHKKQMEIIKGNSGNLARDYRIAQEDLLTARLDEEKQISGLTTGRRDSLIGEAARAKNGGQRNKYTPPSKEQSDAI